MTQALPLYKQRDHFDPVGELAEIREQEGVRRVTTSFGMPAWIVAPSTWTHWRRRDAFQRRTARQLDLSIPMPERIALQQEGRVYVEGLVAGISSLLLIAGHG
jgi:hypothetical protein